MWVKSISLNNFRSFPQASLEFSQGINILIGANNSGKSSIMLPLLSLQNELPTVAASDLRIGEAAGSVNIVFGSSTEEFFSKKYDRTWIEFVRGKALKVWGYFNKNSQKEPLGKLAPSEPGNFIYPFLSKRKVITLSDKISESTVNSVLATFENLNAKIDELSNAEFVPAYELYKQACNNILDFVVSTAVKGNGKQGVYVVQNAENIPLLSMGAGIMNILGLVVYLAVAENKLFLVEEPENDIHPQALKALLDLVVEKSATNQFIVTTHSNIVLKKLGSAPDSKVFKVSYTLTDRLPTSTVDEVPPNPKDRRDILCELGYEFNDVDLWDGWLFLEESSAEMLIRKYFIPWFAPTLRKRLRTYSADSVSKVKRRFEDFNNLFVFLHLEPTYKNKVWVVVDGGEEEKKIIDKLVSMYTKSGWQEDHFRQFQKHEFESYYPDPFTDEVERIKQLPKKQDRRAAKQKLLLEVDRWIIANPETAKKAFKESAADVVTVLKDIEREMKQPSSKQPAQK